MIATILFLGFLAWLYKYSVYDRWWIGTAAFIYLLTKAGYELNTLQLAGVLIVSKVLKDLHSPPWGK